MSDRRGSDIETLSPSLLQRVDEVCDRFEQSWKAGKRPRIEDYLTLSAAEQRSAWLQELLCLELAYRRRNGEIPSEEEYRRRFSAQADLVARVFHEVEAGQEPPAEKLDVSPPTSLTQPLPVEEVEQPSHLGRYRVTATLGRGGFGVVYRGYDEELQRDVAIKVSHRHRVAELGGVDSYLAEARILAGLDHPHIVPVHDLGRTEDGLCFIVSKFIEGDNLAARMRKGRLSVTETAELVAVVAEALHYAHGRGFVHRDIKPGNILLDKTGNVFVTDFGMALKEEDFGKEAKCGGTPAYMSPEQARGEGHRVDGRCDIFSLGVVFYELLTGRRPFAGDSPRELLERITTVEPRPPRQCDEMIPKELERICLKALGKRPSERYSIAKDMSEDLRCWLDRNRNEGSGPAAAAPQPASAAPGGPPAPAATGGSTATPTPRTNLDSDQPANVIPKGLRSFDANDADFFLALVPGPRDREGLPDSLRFWKSRIEPVDSEKAFPVGLLYGPSGCGKSSLVKAGLLPRLAEHVIAIYIEATAQHTETRLLRAVRKHCPDLPGDLGLAEALAALRRGRFLPPGKKVLLILDQFEQWLHATRAEQDTELVTALRQCDGERVQCLLMVRDDYWMAATRCMEALEIPLVQGENTAAVDLFDLRHAKKVLASFGRAFGALPEPGKESTKEQAAFLEQAVQDLAQEGKIISVRLALFAEMVKGKPWVPATLQHLGGIAGVGVAFLEETFAASTAPPQHRFHRKAAQATLKRLLPETGTELRGPMRSRQELLQASGYGSRPREFEDLLRILDSELRLLTPADPESVGPEDRPVQTRAGEQYYQLTHDYLVPSLQTWLTRKQKESRGGRAELRLAERAALWSTNPENRFLPAWWEWADICLFTRRRDWTTGQRKLMTRATRYHVLRSSIWAAAFLLLAWGYHVFRAHEAWGQREQLLSAEIGELPKIVAEMAPSRRWIDPLLRNALAQAEQANNSRKKLRLSLALLPVDPGQRDYLYERLLSAEPNEVLIIRDFLAPFRKEMTDRLWAVLDQPAKTENGRRLRAACALARYDPESPHWDKICGSVVSQLVTQNPLHLGYWIDSFRPIRQKLLDPLTKLFRDPLHKPTERSLAAVILADYAADKPALLADLLMGADENQVDVLYAKIENHADQARFLFQNELAKPFPRNASEEAKEALAKWQANAAVALLRMNHPEQVWPLLQHSPDPRARSYLIDRLHALKAVPQVIVKRLHEEQNVSIRRALLLILGGVSEQELPVSEREKLLPELFALYRDDPDPGLHGAVAWLLRQWNQRKKLQKIDLAWAKNKEYRAKTLERIRRELQNNPRDAQPRWYVNSQGQTFTVLPGPAEFTMGSPFTEEGRLNEEVRHKERIDHSFALATTHVTVEQFKRSTPFRTYNPGELRIICPTPDCPAIGISWYMAALYCNWLSLQEGVPKDQLCYLPNQKNRYLAGMRLAPDYLQRTGYRLPTEAEWEYACRAGAATSRYYGQCDELLEQYAWYDKNSQNRTWPVGSLKPNDWGLFDMHGLLWVWCQDSYHPYGLDHAEDTTIEDKVFRLLRGGTFTAKAVNVRSAHRQGYQPDLRLEEVGFRLARTIR
jgi:serine/threonine protein kinase/formylglycine-generating enzyme required for sulfatase activity